MNKPVFNPLWLGEKTELELNAMGAAARFCAEHGLEVLEEIVCEKSRRGFSISKEEACLLPPGITEEEEEYLDFEDMDHCV